MPTLKAIHIAKSHQPTRKPKLGKECVCSNPQPTENQDERRTPNAQQRFGVMAGSVLRMTVLW
jgi:hypothetical protein